ncbi:MAG: asparagine synthase (glutamine-hydrolyzing) [Sulfuricellaceae bacterium]|jgi:asparagine synthase (glutamine-hydrolysing)
MCGILGLIDTPWRDDDAHAALKAMGQRGPDEQALRELPGAVLGHARLAIIDVAGGHQPMATPDERFTLVFNGEIYNFPALRHELESKGHSFSTHSDTEVLLHGYTEWGEGVVKKLDGMFAFAVWDREKRQLFAARDRVGIKPLFYSTANGFAFASTLAPFFALRGFPTRLDYEALRDYLAFQTVLAPASFLRDVRQLPPAGWLRYEADGNRLETGGYWSIPAASRIPPNDPDVLADEFDRLLADSVNRQMVADVPLGAFLSGGIDSSLMVHYMAQAGARPLRTFSMRFDQAGYDESAHALAVARHYGAEHHVIDAPDIGPDQLLDAIRGLDQPLADPAYVTTAELARLTRQHVTVAISGDGGDELFGGYGRFRDVEAKHPDSARKRALRALIGWGLLPGTLLRRSLAGQDLLLYRKVELGPYETSRKSLKHYLTLPAWKASHPEATLSLWLDLARSFGGHMDTDSLMRADLWTYLSENCLMKTDRASMRHSLEVRVPLLSNSILDAALALPSSAHFDRSGGKAILRRIARRHLPEEVWNRHKHGFSVPLQAYFNGGWKELGNSYFHRAGQLAPFLNQSALAALWRDACRGKSSRRLAYTFLTLLIWLDGRSIEY